LLDGSAVSPVGTDGAVVSGRLGVVNVTPLDAADVPEALYAATVTVCEAPDDTVIDVEVAVTPGRFVPSRFTMYPVAPVLAVHDTVAVVC
jgi:hypothetical protein